MGYPNFGKVKTVVLPIPNEELTLDEYKEKYGIDLRELVTVSDDYVSLRGDIAYYCYDAENRLYEDATHYLGQHSLFPISAVSTNTIGNNNFYAFGFWDSLEGGINGIQFKMAGDFKYENLTVIFTAI